MKNANYLLARVRFDDRVANVEPLGLEYLAAVLKKQNKTYNFHDQILYRTPFRISHIIKRIKKLDIDYLIVTIMSDKAEFALKLITKVKKTFPEIKVILGGPEVNINYRDFYLDNIDVVYFDYGLKSFEYAVSVDFDPDKLGDATGIAYKKNGKWIEKTHSEPVSHYHVRPERSLYYNNRKKYRIIGKGSFSTMKSSFSCPQKCNFCISRKFNGGHFAQRDVDHVIDEIMEIDNDRIWMIDDDFLVDRKRLIEICNKLIEKKCYKTYMVFARADSVVNNQDILPLLYKAGFRDMLVGLEAVEDKFLEQYNKNSTVETNLKAVRLLREQGILCNGLFVISDEFTQKNFNAIHRFIKKEKLIWVLFSILIPFKGTQLYEDNKDRLYKYRYSRTDGTRILLPPKKMSKFRFFINFHLLYYINYPRLYLATLLKRYNKYVNKGMELK